MRLRAEMSKSRAEKIKANSYSFIFSHLFSKKKLEYFLIFVFLLFSKKKCISYTYVRVGSDKFNLDTNILSKNTSNSIFF